MNNEKTYIMHAWVFIPNNKRTLNTTPTSNMG